MGCNSTGSEWRERRGIMAVKTTLLLVILGLLVFGNCTLIRHFSARRKHKWVASDCLVRCLGVIGLLTGLINVTVTTTNLLAGGWVLGDGVCQLYGVVSSVLTSSWTWLLTLAAMERYTKLLVPTEHASLFSEVNTKLIAWGTVLLQMVLYLAPIYGWGEYTPFRGKLDLAMDVSNFSLVDQSVVADVRIHKPVWYAHFIMTSTMDKSPYRAAVLHLSRTDLVQVNPPTMSERGFVFPLRVSDSYTLKCLWRDYQLHVLRQELEEVLATNLTRHYLNITGVDVSLHISRTQYTTYKQVFMNLQESSTCGLDYSGVNRFTYSFVGFSWFSGIGVPVLFSLYFYICIFHAGLDNLCFLSGDGRSPEDARSARVLAFCTLVSFGCDVPFHVANLSAGLGYFVPASVLFLSTFLLYFRCSVLFLFCWLTGCLSEDSCCIGRALRAGSCVRSEESTVYGFADVKQRLLISTTNNSCTQSQTDGKNNGSNAHTTPRALAEGETAV